MKSPSISDALYALGCKGGWKIKNGQISGWTCETPQPTNETIQAKLKELETEYENQGYARSRKEKYPSYGEQLDYIFHHGIEKWKTDIVQPIKDKYPKPT